MEDDEISEQFISAVVHNITSQLLLAKTGKQAIDILKNNPDIDLILMDIKLPEINGYDATGQIRQINQKVIIIAQTAFGLLGDKEKAIEAGCNDYISKPIFKDELLGIISKYFDKDVLVNKL